MKEISERMCLPHSLKWGEGAVTAWSTSTVCVCVCLDRMRTTESDHGTYLPFSLPPSFTVLHCTKGEAISCCPLQYFPVKPALPFLLILLVLANWCTSICPLLFYISLFSLPPLSYIILLCPCPFVIFTYVITGCCEFRWLHLAA